MPTPYFQEYRQNRDIAAGIAERSLRRWYLTHPEPSGRASESPDWLTWAASLEIEWDAVFDRELERLLQGLHHGRA